MERSLIAVVNSDEAFLEMMQEFLEDEGYEAVTLKQNHRAFEQIKARKPQLVFIELVLTDPESGWMILNKMRLDPQTTTIPVIIASTATDLIARNEEHLRAKRCDILLKPFDLEELLTMVGKYVKAP
jgi:chemotaxis family two-component system response regulator PixG